MRVVARAKLPTRFGSFTIVGIAGDGLPDGLAALVHGKVNGRSVPIVRLHSQCMTGDVLHSLRCDCRAQLEYSLRTIAKSRAGVLLYLLQEGRGIGLMNKLKAYELQDRGLDTVEANRALGFADDARDFGFAGQALRLLGAQRVKLLSNNPEKVRQLEAAGVEVVERLPCQPRVSHAARKYLRVKRDKMGHLLAP